MEDNLVRTSFRSILPSVVFALGLLPAVVIAHSIEDMKNEVKGTAIPSEISNITELYGKALPGPIRERLHGTQHDMLLKEMNQQSKVLCVELLQNIAALEPRHAKLKVAGNADEAQTIQTLLDQAKAMTTVNCSKASQR
jgi:hypothetical protein